MEKIIAENFGCKIMERGSKIYIQYDNGQASSWIVENEITGEEAEKAMKSGEYAYEVILEAEKRSKPTRVL
ncbi:MAG: hypothetical protein WAQ28_00855 [Bacteroidia bacterium]|jgi:hypothetical protein